MNKTRFLLFLFCLPAIQLFAQDRTADRQELHNLLQERKEKFDAYSSSLEKRSGFFGGKSKIDIKRTNEVLIDIVKTDNRIIGTLNRVADFRTFEKVNINYDLVRCNEQLNNLSHAVDTLNKQRNILAAQNDLLKTKASGFKWLTFGLLSLVVAMLILLLRKRI